MSIDLDQKDLCGRVAKEEPGQLTQNTTEHQLSFSLITSELENGVTSTVC